MELKPLLETNVYTLRGRVLIAGACLPEVWPEAFAALAAEADQVYSLCLEASHLNMAVTKLTAVLGTGQVESLRLPAWTAPRTAPSCTTFPTRSGGGCPRRCPWRASSAAARGSSGCRRRRRSCPNPWPGSAG